MQINMCSITDEAQTSAECPHMSSVSNASIILRVSCWCVSEWATDCLKNLSNFALFCFCSCSYDAFEIVWVLFFRWSLIICQSQVSVLDRLQARLQGKWFVGRKGAIYLCYLAHKCSAVVFPTERCCAGVGWRMIQTRFSHSFMFAFLRCSVSHWVLSFREEWLRLYNGHSQTPTIRGCRNVCENENKVLYQRYSRHLQTNESSKNIRTIAYAQLHKHQPPSTHSHTHTPHTNKHKWFDCKNIPTQMPGFEAWRFCVPQMPRARQNTAMSQILGMWRAERRSFRFLASTDSRVATRRLWNALIIRERRTSASVRRQSGCKQISDILLSTIHISRVGI